MCRPMKILVAFAFALIATATCAFSQEKPNVLLIIADDKYKHEPKTIEETSNITRILPFLSEIRILGRLR